MSCGLVYWPRMQSRRFVLVVHPIRPYASSTPTS